IHNPRTARGDHILRRPHRIVSGPGRAKAIARIREIWLEHRFEHHQEHLLNHAVHYRWNAEQALASAGLGDRDTSYRTGNVVPSQQDLADSCAVKIPKALKLTNGHPVYASRALVLPHAPDRLRHIFRVDD